MVSHSPDVSGRLDSVAVRSEVHTMVAELAAITVFILTAMAEWLHYRRSQRVGHLAFGPAGSARAWTTMIPAIRVVCLVALTWSLVTLWLLAPKLLIDEITEPSSQKSVVKPVATSIPAVTNNDSFSEITQPVTALSISYVISF